MCCYNHDKKEIVGLIVANTCKYTCRPLLQSYGYKLLFINQRLLSCTRHRLVHIPESERNKGPRDLDSLLEQCYSILLYCYANRVTHHSLSNRVESTENNSRFQISKMWGFYSKRMSRRAYVCRRLCSIVLKIRPLPLFFTLLFIIFHIN